MGSNKHRIFWRYVVDVLGGEIRAVRETAVWDVGDSRNGARSWKRVHWQRDPLRVEFGRYHDGQTSFSESQTTYAKVQGDRIVLRDGGFLRLHDPGLEGVMELFEIDTQGNRVDSLPIRIERSARLPMRDSPRRLAVAKLIPEHGVALPKAFYELAPTLFEPHSWQHWLAYRGENIRLEVQCVVEARDGASSLQPIFYFAQPPAGNKHAVSLVEELQLGENGLAERRLHCTISYRDGEVVRPLPLEPSDWFALDGFHTVAVAEDQDTAAPEGKPPPVRFEMRVDAIPVVRDSPLGDAGGAGVVRYPFWTKPVLFYIGYHPRHQTTLTGEIQRLVFDPNSSCNPCVG